jgi:hypothetical protein
MITSNLYKLSHTQHEPKTNACSAHIALNGDWTNSNDKTFGKHDPFPPHPNPPIPPIHLDRNDLGTSLRINTWYQTQKKDYNTVKAPRDDDKKWYSDIRWSY